MKKLAGHALNIVRGYGKPQFCYPSMVLSNCLQKLPQHSRRKEEQDTPNKIHEETTPLFDVGSRVCLHNVEQSLQRFSKGKWLVVSCISDSGQDYTLQPCVRRPISRSCLYYELYNGAIKMLPCRSFASSANSQAFSNGKAEKVSPDTRAYNEDSQLELKRQHNCWRLWQQHGLSIDDVAVTTIHIGLVHVMLGRGLSSDDIMHCVRIAYKDPSTAAGDPEVGNKMYQYIGEDGSMKKIVTESGMLQWLKKSNGATLSQIVHDFSDCDEIYLMRLILYLEENSLIFRHEGKFRVRPGKLINSSCPIVRRSNKFVT